MTPAELHAALTAIGWSGRELAIRIGSHRNLPTAWLQGRTPIPPPIATWLNRLARLHQQNPPPSNWRTASRAVTAR
jgi:hypothetical protein